MLSIPVDPAAHTVMAGQLLHPAPALVMPPAGREASTRPGAAHWDARPPVKQEYNGAPMKQRLIFALVCGLLVASAVVGRAFRAEGGTSETKKPGNATVEDDEVPRPD